MTPTPAPLVHHYDTRLHQILCGLRGFDHRSTKHTRGVTCGACVALLGKRSTAAASSASYASTGSTAS